MENKSTIKKTLADYLVKPTRRGLKQVIVKNKALWNGYRPRKENDGDNKSTQKSLCCKTYKKDNTRTIESMTSVKKLTVHMKTRLKKPSKCITKWFFQVKKVWSQNVVSLAKEIDLKINCQVI